MADDLICPLPLLQMPDVTPATLFGTTVLYAAPDTDCVLPCPTFVYDGGEWESLKNLLFVGSLCALLSSLVAFLSHISQFYKYYIRTMFIGGFLMSSAVVFFFAVMNRDEAVTCTADRTAFIQQGPICVFQACASVFVFTWIELWSFILAYDSYLMVHNRQLTLYSGGDSQPNTADGKMRVYKQYTVLAVVVCSILTLIPLAAGNMGFDPEQNVPICLFLFSTDSTYFWYTFFWPFTLFSVGCIVFSVMGICQIQSIFVSSPRYFGDGGSVSMYSDRGGNARGARGDGLSIDTADSSSTNGQASRLATTRDSIAAYSDDSDEDEAVMVIRESEFFNRRNSAGTGTSSPLLRDSHMSSGSGFINSGHGQIRLRTYDGNSKDHGQTQMQNSFFDDPHSEQDAEAVLASANAGTGAGSSTSTGSNSSENSSRMSVSNVFLLSPQSSAAPSAANSKQSQRHLMAGVLAGPTGHGAAAGTAAAESDLLYNVSIGGDGDANSTDHMSQMTCANLGEHSKQHAYTHEQLRGAWASEKLEQQQQRGDAEAGVASTVDESDPDVDHSQSLDSPERFAHGHRSQSRDLRTRTESGFSQETISLNTDGGDSSVLGSEGGGCEMGEAIDASLMNKLLRKNKRKQKKSLIKRTRDRVLGLLTENEVLAKTLKYNGRAIVFVVIFCLTTLYIVPLLADLEYFSYERNQDGATDYLECLLQTSLQSQQENVNQNVEDVSSYVQGGCGKIPTVRPPMWAVGSALSWYAAYGIIPALVFGAGSFMVDCCCIRDTSVLTGQDSFRHSVRSRAGSDRSGREVA